MKFVELIEVRPHLAHLHFSFAAENITMRTRFRKACNRVGNNRSCAWHRFRAEMMYTLNFPNGNVQTYSSSSELKEAAHLLGGEAKLIRDKTYAFVPKK